MDYLAHGLWSYILFHWIKKPWKAIFFGLLPDNLSWAVFFFYNLIYNGFGFGAPVLDNIPDWVFVLYNISHSLIIAFSAIAFSWMLHKKFPLVMLAWPTAIVMDLFSHKRSFLPTPFLWPISEWRFPGISWASLEFMVVNYALIIICLIYIYLKRR